MEIKAYLSRLIKRVMKKANGTMGLLVLIALQVLVFTFLGPTFGMKLKMILQIKTG
jgi:hypothetical protein